MVTSEFDSLFTEKLHEQYEPVSAAKVTFDCDSVPQNIVIGADLVPIIS